MGRPRNTTIKLVLDVPEVVYQRIAVRAFQLNESVTAYATRTLDVASGVVVPLPLLDAVAPVPPVPSAEAVVEPPPVEAAKETKKRKG